ncbi:MAG: hypothetical protein NE328_00970 [Lentisphaeraceae bacterium]|nr:hypothetical protein [Lentisphaeraceae bacterium]
MKYLCVLFLLFAVTVSGQDYVGGKTVDKITCDENTKWSYAAYFPKSYDHKREEPWPVMFIFTPGGGNAGTMKKMIEGAELCDAILICSIETSNSYKENGPAMYATVNDVRKKFKIHPDFTFVTGFSGGGRRAYYMAGNYEKGKFFTGCIPCGAGEPSAKIPRNSYYFGLSGTNCYNRDQMVVSLLGKIKKYGKLRFEIGAHMWPGEKLYTEAMAFLYANNLNKLKAQGSEYDLYIEKFCLELRAMASKESDVYRKFELLSTLALVMKNKDLNDVRKELSELTRSDEIEKYLDARKYLDKFLSKYYRNSYSVPKGQKMSDRAVKDMDKLLKKYDGLPLTEIMKKLAENVKH